jgi:hypothetical protein
MADDLERLLAGESRAHHLLDIARVTYPECVHAFRHAFLARPYRNGRVCRSHPYLAPSF